MRAIGEKLVIATHNEGKLREIKALLEPFNIACVGAAELDLMIVGSRRHGPLRRALLGGVTHRLMHHCPSPLLVLPRDASPATFGL